METNASVMMRRRVDVIFSLLIYKVIVDLLILEIRLDCKKQKFRDDVR